MEYRGGSTCFRSFDERLRLLYRLKQEGLYVRMHAYEYLVGDGARLLGIIVLEPYRCRAEIYGVPGVKLGDLRRLASIVENYYPGIEVEIIVNV